MHHIFHWNRLQRKGRAWTKTVLFTLSFVLVLSVFLPLQSPVASGHATRLADRASAASLASVVLRTQHALHAPSTTAIHANQSPVVQLRVSHHSGGCPSRDAVHTVVRGDTISALAFTSGIPMMDLATRNALTNPNLILVGQVLCLPSSRHSSRQKTPFGTHPAVAFSTGAAIGQVNPYPYGQCTWWANQRFSQIHGYFVPWTTNANAWQWTARAYDYGWQVASTPSVGAIVDLQPWVHGAYALGHVAYVEQVLPNGDVLASNLNWGADPGAVVNVEFSPGPGVTFLSR